MTADCKFCQNLQSATVAINTILLIITRGGAIEIKPSTPGGGVIENRNFWFHTPPPGAYLWGGDWKRFTGTFTWDNKTYWQISKTQFNCIVWNEYLFANLQLLSTAFIPFMPLNRLQAISGWQYAVALLDISCCYWLIFVVPWTLIIFVFKLPSFPFHR